MELAGAELELPILTGLGGVALGAIGVWLNLRSERDRRQPIVIAHEDQSRMPSRDGDGFWYVLAHVVNESGPAGFNVRFGVEYNGVRFPYRMTIEDPDPGNVQRVVAPGARLPADMSESFPILLASRDVWHTAAIHGPVEGTAVYWCRYENAQGQTWETRNPANRSSKLDIRRVRWSRLRERRELKRLRQTRKQGRKWEARALEELRSRPPSGEAP